MKNSTCTVNLCFHPFPSFEPEVRRTEKEVWRSVIRHEEGWRGRLLSICPLADSSRPMQSLLKINNRNVAIPSKILTLAGCNVHQCRNSKIFFVFFVFSNFGMLKFYDILFLILSRLFSNFTELKIIIQGININHTLYIVNATQMTSNKNTYFKKLEISR